MKNSWGGEWGDRGYIRMRRDVGEEGQCGIAMVASFPIKKGPNPPTPPPTPPKPTPPPAPEPVDCDASTQCPAGSTCCCMREFFGWVGGRGRGAGEGVVCHGLRAPCQR